MNNPNMTQAQQPSLPSDGQPLAGNVDHHQAGAHNDQFAHNLERQRGDDIGRKQAQPEESQKGAEQHETRRYADDIDTLDPNVQERSLEKQAWGQDGERSQPEKYSSPYATGYGESQVGQQSAGQSGAPWSVNENEVKINASESQSGSSAGKTMQNQHRHYAPDYDRWRKEQSAGLDQDYDSWRQEQTQQQSGEANVDIDAIESVDSVDSVESSNWQKNSDGAHSTHQQDVAGDATRDSAINAEHAKETAAGKEPSTPGHVTETSVHLSK